MKATRNPKSEYNGIQGTPKEVIKCNNNINSNEFSYRKSYHTPLQHGFHKPPCFYFNDKLHTHLVSLKPTASTSTLLLQGENVPFELELIGNFTNQYPCIDFNG